MKIASLVIGFVILFVIVTFAATGYDFAMFKFWAPKYQDARREVFENTQSYVQGKVAYMTTLRYQYQSATGEQRASLRTLILSEASTIREDQMPAELNAFVNQLKGEQQ